MVREVEGYLWMRRRVTTVGGCDKRGGGGGGWGSNAQKRKWCVVWTKKVCMFLPGGTAGYVPSPPQINSSVSLSVCLSVRYDLIILRKIY